MRKLTLLLIIAVTVLSQNTSGQVSWLDSDNKSGKVTLVKDSRIDDLNDFRSSAIPPAFEPQMEGYRVQLFFDQERNNINDARAKFMTLRRNTPTYIDFKAPNYNLAAGDFRDQLSAEKLRASIAGEFPEAIVITTKIYLPRIEE